jgi:hypothetical protein
LKNNRKTRRIKIYCSKQLPIGKESRTNILDQIIVESVSEVGLPTEISTLLSKLQLKIESYGLIAKEKLDHFPPDGGY